MSISTLLPARPRLHGRTAHNRPTAAQPRRVPQAVLAVAASAVLMVASLASGGGTPDAAQSVATQAGLYGVTNTVVSPDHSQTSCPGDAFVVTGTRDGQPFKARSCQHPGAENLKLQVITAR